MTVIVGPSEKVFTVHAALLLKYISWDDADSSDQSDKGKAKMVFDEDDPAIFSHLINFLYTNRVQQTPEMESWSVRQKVKHWLALYSLADRFSIKKLADLTMNYFLPLVTSDDYCLHPHVIADVDEDVGPDAPMRKLIVDKIYACISTHTENNESAACNLARDRDFHLRLEQRDEPYLLRALLKKVHAREQLLQDCISAGKKDPGFLVPDDYYYDIKRRKSP